jgi:arylsulfate sulfotransferase
MVHILRCWGALLLATLLAACSGSSSVPGAPPDGIAVKLLPAYSDQVAEYSLEEASVSRPMVIELAALRLPERFVAARFESGEPSLRLPRLSSEISFGLVLREATGAERTIRVRATPADFPRYTTTISGAAAPGEIYAGVFNGQGLANPAFNMIFSSDGTPLYFRRMERSAINFQKIVYPDGTVRYAHHDIRFPVVPGKGSADGDVVLLNENFREIRRLRLKPFRNHGELPAENHDFIFFGDDHYVIPAYDVRTVDLSAFGGKPDSKVVAAVVQEVRDGVVQWEWDSTDYPQLYAASVRGNDYTNTTSPVADYVHFNSVEFDPVDRTYLLSFRHLNAVIKIAPAEPRAAGAPIAIKWILGGALDQFGLTPEQRFYHQHDARVQRHAGSMIELSIFNNNNDHYDEHPSSGMLFSLDEAAKSARVLDEYHDSMFSSSQGSMQVLGPRHYFIGWGSDNRISESVAGNRVFLMDFDGAQLIYRARKVVPRAN